jgi:hypothetical protein
MPNAALPGWKPLTGLDEQGANGGRLLGALLTTFDPPDPGLLIEEYLPAWLGLENSYADEGIDRLRYFAELGDALRRLKGQIAIVSSAGEVGTSAEAWIWNYIRRFEVGAEGAAVQHAKLWMFHRAPATKGESETLELVISSANLTRDGLRGQIQAGWRCVFQLEARGSDSRSETWGVLPYFLTAVGAAAGNAGPKTVDSWVALLRRCECPEGVEFIASVPGAHSATTLARRRSAWGAAGLRASWSGRSKPKMIAMAPTIGRWTSKSIEAWTRLAGIEPGRMSLAWVRGGHPWAGRWQLDPSTEEALTGSGIHWLEVPRAYDDDWGSPLCDEHQQTDPRWSHAKLYELREGARRRMLITSANLSRAAWGDPQRDGGLVIDNFELGVLLGVQEGFGDRLWDVPFERATCAIDYEQPREPPIAWLAAEWDGEELNVECRMTSGTVLALHVEVTVARSKSGKRVATHWRSGAVVRTKVSWSERAGVPVLIAVEARGGYVRQAAVHDIRPTDDGEILCGEFDEDKLREELDRLLEERYGYLPDAGSDDTGGNGGPGDGVAIAGADYAVPAYVDARRRFQLIDNWWKELRDSDERARPFILKDGRRILERWTAVAKSGSDRGIRLAAQVAADELALRMRRFA